MLQELMPPVKKNELIKFQKEIEDLVWKLDVPYMEAIIIFCEENDFEIEEVPRYLTDNMRTKLQIEAEELSMLKTKTNRLPL